MFDRFNDQLDAIDVFLTAAKTVMQIANAVLDMFAQFTVVGDEAADGVFAYVEGIITETLAVVRAGDTTDWRIAMKCALYCRLLATGGSFGTDRALILDGWESDISALSAIPIGVAFRSFIQTVDIQTFQIRARVSNNNVGECDDCEACGPDLTVEYADAHGGAAIGSGPTLIHLNTEYVATGTLSGGGCAIFMLFSRCVKVEIISTIGYVRFPTGGGYFNYLYNDCDNNVQVYTADTAGDWPTVWDDTICVRKMGGISYSGSLSMRFKVTEICE